MSVISVLLKPRLRSDWAKYSNSVSNTHTKGRKRGRGGREKKGERKKRGKEGEGRREEGREGKKMHSTGLATF